MTRLSLTVNPRAETGKNENRRLRAAGKIPAVLYGKGKAPITVSADPKEVVGILHSSAGKNAILNLTLEGDKTSRLAMIKDYQVHPWKRNLRHVDLMEITEDADLKLTVPFRRTGRAESERLGAKVRIVREQLVVMCKPADVPDAIEFDMTNLADGDHNIHISDVTMPKGVRSLHKDDFSIIQLKMPRAELAAAADTETAAAE